MHELGITRSIVDIAERTAREHGGNRVTSVTVEIGALSGVIPDAVEFCFEACSKGTLLDGARLIVESIPGLGRCPDCGREQEIDNHSFACGDCGALGLERLRGEELRVKELEVD
ncbi:hydrogenase maturation nickel metallochaperone HypA [Geothermobacter hydrogeniphilus]|uniref:Hydrogenase maturation factor HypA n=1 Tax=Geothermobacter hydrogeniphilus TaxID=1969733 RepID=A0A1X0Y0U7_9BACT|nr:hydrogenase maturation nickel metallochaperone HypA [Geothermobacter hydrogeniphilus]ORJ58727.1 hydrogenase maturation nickel metallochaperone HypA [Geothermobacter hydrogeniphilus]